MKCSHPDKYRLSLNVLHVGTILQLAEIYLYSSYKLINLSALRVLDSKCVQSERCGRNNEFSTNSTQFRCFFITTTTTITIHRYGNGRVGS